MPRPRSSIRARLITLIISVALPLLAVLAVAFIQQVRRDTAAARELAHRIARSVSSDLHDDIVHSRRVLARMASRPRITSAAECDPMFAVVDFFPQYIALQLFDGEGRPVCGSAPASQDAAAAAMAERWAMRMLRSGSAVASRPFLFATGSRWVLVVFHAVAQEGGRGRMLALYQSFDFNVDAYPPGTLVTIVDGHSTVVARSRDPEKWAGRRVNAAVVGSVLARHEGSLEAAGIDGQMREYGFTPVAGTDWYLYVGIPARVAMAAVRTLVLRGSIVGLLLIGAVIGLAIRFSQAIERPLDHLAEAARHVTEQGYTGVLAVDGPAEIATVADAFNTMVARRGEAEAALEASRGQLEALSNRLLQAQEEERTRVGREIHDELGQLLTALNMDVGGLIAAAAPLPPSKQPMADRIEHVLAETLSSVQRISAELRPPMLDDFGLPAAIESYVRSFEERTGIECELSVPSELPRLKHEAETAIYRIVQESLTNIARHSDAVRAEVRVRVRPEALLLDVRDDGRGITTDQLRARSSIGIAGMRERASRIGATVDIEGISGQGTIVSVRLPLGSGEGSPS